MTDRFLPYTRQSIDDDDVAAVGTALRDEFITTGPRVKEFERLFAQATGAREAVVCNSGTAALHLAVLAAGINSGDQVVVPAISFLATANVVRMAGAEVVFADVGADTGLMTPETLEAALSGRGDKNIRAAIPVHLGGQVCDMAGFAEVAAGAGAILIEDACHALGEADVGATAHSLAACFSTHPAKAMTTGEGGVVTTADTALAARMRRLRNHGIERDSARFANKTMAFDGSKANPWYYELQEIGWNYRLPDILCALGISQLKKLDGFTARRRQIAALYDRLLAPLAPCIRPVPHGNHPHGWHLYIVLVDFDALGMTRRRLMQALRERGIGSQVHYIPLHRQPYYRDRYGDIALPGADAYYARCLSIPCYPAMTDADVERVAQAVIRIVRGAAA